ncbi:hypothetical protein IV102_00755 [bacterium]|nr:hypothetical protein [bacterium]
MKITSLPPVARKVLDYTLPRPTTASNYAEPQVFQAVSSATIEGFYMLGLSGAVTNAAATVVGLTTQQRFGKLPGALAGAATGAGLAAAAGALMGTGSPGVAAVFGGLCGAYSTLRGNQESRFRDAGAFGLTFGSPLLQGGAKAGIGLASVLAAEFEGEGTRALVAGGLGVAAGVAFSLTGYSGLSPVMAALACGGISIFGSVAGPRLAMVMRNASEDMGKKMVHPNQPAAERSLLSRTAGVLPMAAFRQGVMAFTMGRFDPTSVAIGFGLDASMSAYEVYLNSREDKKPPP